MNQKWERVIQSLGKRLGMAVIVAMTGVTAMAQVVINEIMADNQGAVENGSTFPDFIELHNTSGVPLSVGNMRVTDDPAVPSKYVIPAGTTIVAGGYLVLWCDVNFSAPGLHTGFGLGASSDRVQLYAADGFTLLDDVAFGISVPDLTFGRFPNGNGPWALTQPTPSAANVAQVLGLKTQLRLNEWMASPGAGLEDWIEVYNGSASPVALGGLVITDAAAGIPGNRAIPALSFIPAQGYVQFFASDLASQNADHLDFKLGAGGETLTIYDADRFTIIDRVVFGAQSAGISQGRAPDGSDNIIYFPTGGATPEAPNQIEITNVVISEVLSHTDPPLEDAIELQNLTASPVDISDWWLSDSASDLKRYRIPAGTVIPAFGFKVFYQYQFSFGPTGFSLNSVEGDDVYLSSGDATGALTGARTSVHFGALVNGRSVGRVQTSSGVDFVPLSSRTFGVDNPGSLAQFRAGGGLSNAAPRVGPIVISEIHYQPAGGAGDLDEFIELHNISGGAAPLFDVNYPANSYRLRGGIEFDLPAGLVLNAGGFVVIVSFDPAAFPSQVADFRARFNVPSDVLVVGPFSGRLSNSGEAIELQHPDTPETSGPMAGFVPYEHLDGIEYGIASPWPAGAAGTGASLQRLNPAAYGNEPLNWQAASPSPGSLPTMDSDGDGMPNDWESAHGLNQNVNDAESDADNDGANNLAEYRSGTDPQSAQSVLKFTSVMDSGAQVTLRFHAVAGRSYQLQARTQLTSGGWLTISNIPAPLADGEVTVSASKIGSARFFQIITSPAP